MVRFAKKLSCETEKKVTLNVWISWSLFSWAPSTIFPRAFRTCKHDLWMLPYTWKNISTKNGNYSNKVIILTHLQPERLHQELHQASLHWEPDHPRYINQQSLITKLAFSLFICVQPIARLKFVADLTDEKDSDPLVVSVVQLLTIVVSFAAMTLVGEILKALFLKI